MFLQDGVSLVTILSVMKWKLIFLALFFSASSFLIQKISVYAQSSSTNYKIEESQIGSGSGRPTSGSYQLRGSLGYTGGFGESNNYGLWAGYDTEGTEYLEFVVSGATIDLGVLDTGATAYATATFYVRTYPASGYVVTTESDPLAYGTHTFTTMSGGAPSPGTEQFGINLVDNSTPVDFGANPSQYPDSSFAHGIAATGYDTANSFKYTKGDVIAKSDPAQYSWGRTDYTISYVINISNITPAGLYEMDHVLVATSTF